MTIKEAKQKHESKLLHIPEVVGVGIGKHQEQQVIMVFVTKLNENLQAQLPDQLEGFNVHVQESGTFRAL